LFVADISIGVAGQGTVIVSDINEAMLQEGKKRAQQLGAVEHGYIAPGDWETPLLLPGLT